MTAVRKKPIRHILWLLSTSERKCVRSSRASGFPTQIAGARVLTAAMDFGVAIHPASLRDRVRNTRQKLIQTMNPAVVDLWAEHLRDIRIGLLPRELSPGELTEVHKRLSIGIQTLSEILLSLGIWKERTWP